MTCVYATAAHSNIVSTELPREINRWNTKSRSDAQSDWCYQLDLHHEVKGKKQKNGGQSLCNRMINNVKLVFFFWFPFFCFLIWIGCPPCSANRNHLASLMSGHGCIPFGTAISPQIVLDTPQKRKVQMSFFLFLTIYSLKKLLLLAGFQWRGTLYLEG